MPDIILRTNNERSDILLASAEHLAVGHGYRAAERQISQKIRLLQLIHCSDLLSYRHKIPNGYILPTEVLI